MTTSRFTCTNRRRFVASSALGGAAVLTMGQPLRAAPSTRKPAAVLAQEGSSGVPMDRGNAARTGEMPGPDPDDSNGVEVIWSIATDDWMWSSLGLVDGILYYVGGTASDDTGVAEEGYLHAVSIDDGAERWRFAIGIGEHVPPSSPAIADGVVYIGGKDILYAVNAEDGAERWQFATDYTAYSSLATPVADYHNSIFSSPAIVDGVVYVYNRLGEGDGDVFGNILRAMDADDGTEHWQFTTEWANRTSSPAIADDAVYFGDEDNLYALNADDGTERWRYAIPNGIGTTPAVVDGVVFVATGDPLYGNGEDHLFAVSAEDGTERWRFSTSAQITSKPAVAAGVVYTASNDGKIYALDANDGTEHWQAQLDGKIWASPTVTDHVVYVGCFGEEGAALYAMNTDDGSERWRFSTDDTLFSYPAVVDGVVYVGSIDGNLYAIGARVPRLEVGGVARVMETTSLRGGPAPTAVERAELEQDAVVTITGESETSGDTTWWPVTVDGTGDSGWVEASMLEPLSSGPEPTATA